MLISREVDFLFFMFISYKGIFSPVEFSYFSRFYCARVCWVPLLTRLISRHFGDRSPQSLNVHVRNNLIMHMEPAKATLLIFAGKSASFVSQFPQFSLYSGHGIPLCCLLCRNSGSSPQCTHPSKTRFSFCPGRMQYSRRQILPPWRSYLQGRLL